MSDWLAALFASGHAVDLVLVFMATEGVFLVAVRRRRAADVLFMLLPGALMLLAVRAALTGAVWWWPALWLALSLPAHLIDVRRRGR